MKSNRKSLILVAVVFSLILFTATSCTTMNPPVNGTTGATKTKNY
ncbi:MAG: hypothetical protein PHR83_19170 [Paludibacter sp.]|nr:hypothetical protein [Paludibacter sp.]